ncbi:MAG TPA: hypothetical protein VFA65_24475 [Bryobacteraceae bacterium]|nr:hypothetical protein [Bryobacteraceae bacterium]
MPYIVLTFLAAQVAAAALTLYPAVARPRSRATGRASPLNPGKDVIHRSHGLALIVT